MQHNTAASQIPPVAPPPLPPFDAEKALTDFLDAYKKSIVDKIMQYPINPNMRLYALINFDQGMFWVKEALTMLKNAAQQQPAVTEKQNRKAKKRKKRKK